MGKVIVIMGVSACGKSTLGRAVAEDLGLPFFDGDDFHPPENVAKMASGVPLQDADRKGWLAELNKVGRKHLDEGAVIACSALKERYRNWLSEGFAEDVVWVYIDGSFEEFAARIRKREGHFMPPALLKSQFETLEVPDYGIHLDAGLPIPEMVARVREATNS